MHRKDAAQRQETREGAKTPA